jgi:hypothetical protein
LLELLLTDVLPVVEQRRAIEKVELRIRHAAKLYRPHAHAASSWIATEAEPALLAVQFVVCVGCWTLVVLALEGAISTSGFIASIVTGVVLVAVTVTLVKLGWIAAPVKPAEIIAEDDGRRSSCSVVGLRGLEPRTFGPPDCSTG